MKKQVLFLLCAGMVLATGCKKSSDDSDPVVNIVFAESSVTVTNSHPSDIVVDLDGYSNDVTVQSSLKNVTYHVSGTCSDAQLRIYSDYKLNLLLDNLTLTNQRASAINIQTSKKITVELQGTSTLTDATIYTDSVADEDDKACFFSEGQLIFTGTGTLNVVSRNRHAICSDDYICVESGTISATSSCKDAMHVKEYFDCSGGTLALTTTDNGTNGLDVSEGYIHISGGNITVNTVSKAIVAAYEATASDTIVPSITIDGGTVAVTTSGKKAHGIRTTDNFTMNGGTLTILATGEQTTGIKADGKILLNGGKVEVTATESCTSVTPIDQASVLQCN